MLLPFDAASDRDDALGLREVDRLLGFAERRFGLLSNGAFVDGRRSRPDRRGRPALLHGVGPKRADLKRRQMRRRTFEHDVGAHLALEHRPREHDVAGLALDRRAVGDERAIEPGGKLGNEVSRLVCVRADDMGRLLRPDERRKRLNEPVGRVGAERLVLERDHFGDISRGKLARHAFDAGAWHHHLDGSADGLCRRDRFPRCAIEGAGALFGKNEEHWVIG